MIGGSVYGNIYNLSRVRFDFRYGARARTSRRKNAVHRLGDRGRHLVGALCLAGVRTLCDGKKNVR